MQTLGLASKPQPTDNLFKRLFWPNIDSGYDVDLLGQQGFWLCTGVAALSTIGLLATGWPTLASIYALAFFLGGCGVRERSIVAAVVVFVLFAAEKLVQMLMGSFGNPIVTAVVVMLLFSNIRATVLAKMWADRPAESDKGELPERGQDSARDRFANVLPAKLWPIGQYVFYPMAVLVLGLQLLGVFAIERARARHLGAASTTQHSSASE